MTGVQVENLRRGATVLTDPLRALRVRSERGARGAEGTEMLAAGEGARPGDRGGRWATSPVLVDADLPTKEAEDDSLSSRREQ